MATNRAEVRGRSAAKRERQAAKNRTKNRAVNSKINTIRRSVLEPKEVTQEDAAKALSNYSSVLDKAVKQGVIKRNTADRRKSRAAKRLAKVTK